MNFDIHLLVMLLTGAVFLGFLYALVNIINGAEDLEWGDLVSTTGKDNKRHPDWNKIGQGLGVILCVWLPAVYVYSPKMDATGLALVMGVALAYLGGVSSYAAMLRAKQGSVQTVTEPADLTPTKVTVTETPPILPKAKK